VSCHGSRRGRKECTTCRRLNGRRIDGSGGGRQSRVEQAPHEVQRALRTSPADVLSVAGEANYILKVKTRTTGELESLIQRLREKAEVHTRTTVVLSVPFEGRPLIP